jgi:hypothetical protein
MAVEIQEKPAALQHIIAEIETLTPPYLYQLRQVLDEKLQALATATATPNIPRIVGTYTPKDRAQENEWVRQHRDEFAGQWVALDGEQLLAHGFNLKEVAEAAQKCGVTDALFVQVEASKALPWAGF